MMKKILLLLAALAISLPFRAQVKVSVHESTPGSVIPAEIYG